MTEETLREEKRRMRREVLKKAKGLSAEYRAEASRRIAEQIWQMQEYHASKILMAFVSLPNEPDTRAVIDRAAADGKTVLLPRCISPERMVALPFTGWEDLEPGWMGIPEPGIPEEGTEIPSPDLVLVPCVTVSPDGRRLGHGAGYYDRFLTGLQAETVCLCFRELAREDIPAGPRDQRVHRVITD